MTKNHKIVFTAFLSMDICNIFFSFLSLFVNIPWLIRKVIRRYVHITYVRAKRSKDFGIHLMVHNTLQITH